MVKRKTHEIGKKSLRAVLCACVVAVFVFTGTNAFALSGKLGDSGKIYVDTTLNYDVAWRLDDVDQKWATTGNNNFDPGDLISNGASILMDVDANWEHFGVFLRGKAFWDSVYADDNTFHPETQHRHGKDAEMLDYFIYTDGLKIGDAPVTLRLGRQVINWGESLLIFNGILTAQNALDITKSNSAGVEVKTMLLPTNQVYAQISTPNVKTTLAGYYKFEWQETRFDEFGSFFNTNDALDKAGTQYGPFPRGNDNDAGDTGEYGVALRYLADNGTEFGLYYLNYHDTLPNAKIDLATFTYFLDYQEDIELFGASVSGVIGDANVAAEVTYRSNQMVRTSAAPFPVYEEGELLQAQVSIFYIVGKLPFADNSVLIAEWGYNTVLDYDNDELYADKWATGGAASFTLSYYDVAPGLDVDVPLKINYNAKGVSAAQTSVLVEDSHKYSAGITLTYLNVYQARITYTDFFGSDSNKDDRDFIALNLKYTF